MNLNKISLNNCSFVKMILMFFVILGHSIAFWTGGWFTPITPIYNSSLLNIVFTWIGSFHTYAFTLVSGYIFEEKIIRGSYREFYPFLKNKIKRLIIPYIFVALFWVIPISNLFFNWNKMDIIRNYVFCENPSQLWFLWMLFWCFCLFWFLRNKCMRFKNLFPSIMFIMFVIGIFGKKYLMNVFCVWNAFQYMIYFYIGMIIRNGDISKISLIFKRLKLFQWIELEIIFFAIKLGVDKFCVRMNIVIILVDLCLQIIGSITVFFILQEIANSIEWNKKIIKVLIKYSMTIYLFHQQIIYITLYVFNGKIKPVTHVIINLLVSLSVALLLSRMLASIKITRCLLGFDSVRK